jgi:hypothetical protein
MFNNYECRTPQHQALLASMRTFVVEHAYCVVILLLGLACCRSTSKSTQLVQDDADRQLNAMLVLLAHRQNTATEDRSSSSEAKILMRRLIDRDQMTDALWRKLVTQLEIISTRPAWPVGEPLVLWVRGLDWLGEFAVDVELKDPFVGHGSVVPPVLGRHEFVSLVKGKRSITMGPMPPQVTQATAQVTISEIEHNKSGFRRAPRVLWSGLLEIPLMSVMGIRDVLTPTAAQEVTNEVRRSLKVMRVVQGDVRQRRLIVGVGGGFEEFPFLKAIGVSLAVKVLRNGEVVQELSIPANLNASYWGGEYTGLVGALELSGVPEGINSAEADLKNWALEVRGVETGLIGVWGIKQYWSGHFEVPLSSLLQEP